MLTTRRRLDTPTGEAYSVHQLHGVRNLKMPYRVLHIPDLADDFYLNFVDWSNTNVLGVSLGSCDYLWTAHNAVV